jgi:hypothetical protein
MGTKAEKKQRSFKRREEKRILGIQRHHITYKPEWIVSIYRGEHWAITQLQRRKYVSTGFIKSVGYELARLAKNAIDLDAKETQAHRQNLLEKRELSRPHRKRKKSIKGDASVQARKRARRKMRESKRL